MNESPAKRHYPPWALALLTSLWLAGPGNAVLWQRLTHLPDGAQASVVGPLALGIVAALMVLLAPLCGSRAMRLACVALALLAAFINHGMQQYGGVIDPSMVTNVLQTDLREAGDLLSWKLPLTLLLLAGPVLVLAWWLPLRRLSPTRGAQHALVVGLASGLLLALVLWASLHSLAPLMRNHTGLRYAITPLNALYGVTRVAASQPAKSQPLQAIGQDIALSPPPTAAPPLLVLVLGETTRSDHFGLNGYSRDTTPRLRALQASGEAVLSVPGVLACGTSTAASLPCMFSHAGRLGFAALEQPHENLLDLLQRAGLAVLWVDNQSGCKGLCDRVPHADTGALRTSPACGTDPDGCSDAVVLDGLSARVAALPAERRAQGVVLVLHPMGSHGPAYYKRSPTALKAYLPECSTAVLKDCDSTQLVNAYDNSVLATDALLANTIGWLKEQKSYRTAMVFVGDHGESLGESGLYLHGMPWSLAPEVQKRVPWIEWFSPAYAQSLQLDMACMARRKDLSHDHLFHSLLGLLSANTSLYQASLDASAPCRGLSASIQAGPPG